MRILGRCPALVELRGTGTLPAALALLDGASNSEVGRLSVSRAAGGLFLFGSQRVIVDQVRIHDAAGRGMSIQDDCQAFDLAAESWGDQPSVFENLGGVTCGCPEATERCQAQSYALAPPPPPD